MRTLYIVHKGTREEHKVIRESPDHYLCAVDTKKYPQEHYRPRERFPKDNPLCLLTYDREEAREAQIAYWQSRIETYKDQLDKARASLEELMDE